MSNQICVSLKKDLSYSLVKKLSRSHITNILFVIFLVIFAAIVLKLPVKWFVVVTPILAAVIFVAILISPEDKENK